MSKVIIIITIAFACFLPTAAFAADGVSSSDLIDKAAEYDGQTVVYTGEVIGDIMPRGEYTWLNVSDSSNAIGVWAKSADVQDIKIAGRYDAHGDTIKIAGIFHRACAEHGGDFDIHAQSIGLIEKGYDIDHPVDPLKEILAVAFFVAASCCMAVILKNKISHKELRKSVKRT